MDIQVRARPHLRHRHPRPGGGDDHGRPHRGDGPRPARPGRAAGRDLRAAERALRRRLRRRHQHPRGAGRRPARTGGWRIGRGGAERRSSCVDPAARRSRPARRSRSRSGRRRWRISLDPPPPGTPNVARAARSGTSAISATGPSTTCGSPTARSCASARERIARRRAADHLGGQGLALLRAGRGDRADEMSRCSPRTAGAPGAPLVIGPPYLWLLVFFLVPFVIVAEDQPLGPGDGAAALPAGVRLARRPRRMARVPARRSTSRTSRRSAADDLYWQACLVSLRIALVSTVLAAPHRLPDRLRHGARAGRRRGRSW